MEQSKKIMAQIEPYYRRKWIIIATTFVGLIVASLVALNMTKYYRSSTMILVEGQKVSQTYVKSLDTSPVNERLSTLKQQILSRTNLKKIALEFNLFKEKKEKSFIDKLKKKIGLDKPAITKTGAISESALEGMRKNVEISVLGGRRGQSGFSVSFSGKDPYRTMQVTDKLASMFINENLKIREQYSEGTLNFLASELEKVKKELEKQETSLRIFKEKNRGNLPEQLNTNLRTLDRFQLELQSVRESLRSSTDRMNLLKDQIASLPQMETVGVIIPENALAVQLYTLKNQLRVLLSTFNENYPDVLIVKNQIKEVENQLVIAEESKSLEPLNSRRSTVQNGNPPVSSRNVELNAVNVRLHAELNTTKSHINTLNRRERRISAQMREYEARVERTPANEQKLIDLTRDYQMSFDNYQSLLSKKINAGLAENLEKRQKGERFRVLDSANLPERPYKPNRKMTALAGGAIGAAFGAGLIFLLEFFNPVFRKPEDFDGLFLQPVLVTIPKFVVNPPKKQAKQLRVVKGGRA